MSNKVAKLLVAGGAAIAMMGTVAFGCAQGDVDFGDADEDDQNEMVANGGAGGTGGGGGAGGGEAFPCGVDCSAIETPGCQVAQCNMTTKQCEVIHEPDGTTCDDGLFCTIKDTCKAGTCVGGPQNHCNLDLPECTQVTCDETTKKCDTIALQNGASCTPTDKCQTAGKCTNGLCIGVKNDCFFAPVPNECHVATCNPETGDCEPLPGNDGGACVDTADLCTVGKTCDNGLCVGGNPKDCSALSKGCFNGKCDDSTGQCIADPLMPGDLCAEATDDCNQGKCDANGKCLPEAKNENVACDDGLSCTANTVCQQGACTGGTSPIQIYLFEDFGSNSAGWTLGTEWQIGPAKVSSGEDYGNPDPGTDHTASNQNNGVAGVVIGGNANDTMTHDYYWLESPAVDTSAASTLYFEYWRWLNSDYTPYMANRVEVWNGAMWVTLFQTGSSGTQDAAWLKQSYDITAHKNAALKVRFGFTIGSTGVYAVSQWNVDDVLISSAACN